MGCGRKAKRAARCDDAEATDILASAYCWLIVFALIDQAHATYPSVVNPAAALRIVRMKQWRCILER